ARHWKIARDAACTLMSSPCKRPALLLMYGDYQYTFVAGKSILDSVRVMRINVNVENAFETGIEKAEDAEHGIVEIAKAAGAIGPAMMSATRGMVDDPVPRREDRNCL